MTTLKPTKIGDRVRFLGHIKRNNGETEKPVGALGTVASSFTFENGIGGSGDSLHVAWDGHPDESTWMENVELVTDEAPTSVADGETQALRERLLDKAIEWATYTDSDVLDTAKAFEAYITGGTK